MARGNVYNQTKVCPLCYSTVEMFGREKDKLWRCTNPLCEKSKEGVDGYGGGIILEEDLIEKNRLRIEVIK